MSVPEEGSSRLGKTFSSSIISFDDIAKGREVRITPVSFNVETFMSCIDLVSCLNEVENKEGARQYRAILDDEKIPQALKDELMVHIARYQFPGLYLCTDSYYNVHNNSLF